MATTKFKGQPVKIIGEFIKTGTVAPDFELVKTDLSSFSLKDMKGKNVILNIFPSLDTSVCATSVRKFNKLAASLPDTVVLVFRISMKAMAYVWQMDHWAVCWHVQ